MYEIDSRVFISYAHHSPEHIDQVRDFSDFLNDPGGIDCWIDRYVEDGDLKEGWPNWMRSQVANAKHVLVICSPTYLERINKTESTNGTGNGVKFESTLIMNSFYKSGSMTAKYIPVVLCSDHLTSIPDFLQGHSHYNLSDPDSKWSLYKKLAGIISIPKPEVKKGKIDMHDVETKIKESVGSKIDIPKIEELMELKPGTKILQAFFKLPITKRFKIASELGLVENGEAFETSPNGDKLSASFLQRAIKKNVLYDLWNILFDTKIDPNPFKKP